MTNTLSTIFATVTSGLTTTVDAYVGVGVIITLGLCAFALAAKFLPRKRKIV